MDAVMIPAGMICCHENYVLVNLNSKEHINLKGVANLTVEVSVDSAKKNLEVILAKLSPGETATLIGPEGRPMAVIVPLRSSDEATEKLDWDREWQALAREIDCAWKSEKSALQVLAEMRRCC